MPLPDYSANRRKVSAPDPNEAELTAALDELQGKKKSGGGFLHGVLKAVGTAAKVADIPRSIVVSGASELGDYAASNILRRDNGDSASWHDFTEGVKNHTSAADIVKDSGLLGKNKLVNGVAGTALDIGADPINSLSFGSGSVAKEGLAKAGQVLGDDAARAAYREAGTQGLRDALEKGGTGDTLESLLKQGLSDTPEGAANIQRTLEAMDKGAKGGIGIGGRRLGVGQATADKVFGGLRESELGKAVRPLLQTTAKVRDAEGVGVASATKNALADAAQAKRLATRDVAGETFDLLDESGRQAFKDAPKAGKVQFLQDTRDAVENAKNGIKNIDLEAAKEAGNKGVETLSDATGTYTAEIQRRTNSAITETLLSQAPDMVSNVPKAGYVDLGNGFHIKQVVFDTLEGATAAKPSDLLKGVDAAMSALKRYTTLGPLNAIPHVTRNIFSNMLFATMYGGVKGGEIWRETGRARTALQDVLKDAKEAAKQGLEHPGITTETLMDKGLSRSLAGEAIKLHEAGLVGRGSAVFDEVGNVSDDAIQRLGEDGKPMGKLRTAARKVSGDEGYVGTRTASKVNEWHEELSRGAVFLQGLRDGLDPSLAARKSREAMLDYSNEGLTKFERDVLQRTLFFYKFPRRAVPAGIKFAVEHPGETMVASRLGAGVDLGARNRYGDPLGTSFDTPLESAFSTASDFAKNPLDASLGMANPVIKAALDDKQRGWQDVIPPLGQATKRQKHLGEGEDVGTTLFSPSGGLLGPTVIPGGRVGVDYDAKEAREKDTKATDKSESRLTSGKAPTALDRLTALARKEGLKNPGALTKPNLLKAMAEAGVPSKDILAALKTPSTKKRILKY